MTQKPIPKETINFRDITWGVHTRVLGGKFYYIILLIVSLRKANSVCTACKKVN